MFRQLPFCLSLLLLSQCSRKNDPPGDPLLGHWQSDNTRLVNYDAQGTVVRDNTRPQHGELDVTATTMSFAYTTPTGVSKDTFTYTRNGEVITVLAGGTGEAQFVRALTPTSFTYEATSTTSNGGKGTFILLFHR
jgi:hypothetical protein